MLVLTTNEVQVVVLPLSPRAVSILILDLQPLAEDLAVRQSFAILQGHCRRCTIFVLVKRHHEVDVIHGAPHDPRSRFAQPQQASEELHRVFISRRVCQFFGDVRFCRLAPRYQPLLASLDQTFLVVLGGGVDYQGDEGVANDAGRPLLDEEAKHVLGQVRGKQHAEAGLGWCPDHGFVGTEWLCDQGPVLKMFRLQVLCGHFGGEAQFLLECQGVLLHRGVRVQSLEGLDELGVALLLHDLPCHGSPRPSQVLLQCVCVAVLLAPRQCLESFFGLSNQTQLSPKNRLGI